MAEKIVASINSLPDEIVHQVLLYVSPEEILSKIALLSKRFNRIAQEPLLWRSYCEGNFKYWESGHRFRERLEDKVHETDWKQLFLLRLGRNDCIARLVNGIVASRVSRLQKIEQICQYGYDAKDYLLSQCRIPDSSEDVLARRYARITCDACVELLGLIENQSVRIVGITPAPSSIVSIEA